MSSDSFLVKRSLLISFVERYSITLMQFVSVMILARLLTPEDIGIYTIGLAIISIAHMIRDFGIGKYLIQEKNLTKEKVATALGLTIVIAWSMGFVVILLAPFLAEFYEEDAVRQVVYVVGLNFFIIPLGAMVPALLRRSMSFGTLLKINLSSTLVSVIAGISLAYMGYGYMSMAWASVANVAFGAIMAQYYMPSKYRVFPSLRNARRIVNFGGLVVGANLANQLRLSALDLLVGKSLGFSTLGMLSRGQGYVKIYENVVQKAIDPVISAHFAKTYRTDNELETSYFYTINYATLVGWFFLGFMGLMSSNLIRILYGDQWDAAAPIASILCITACIVIPCNIAKGLLISTGKVKVDFQLTVIYAILYIALIVIFVEKGVTVLLISLLILEIARLLATYIVIFAEFGFSRSQLISMTFKNLMLITLSLIVPAYLWLLPNTDIAHMIMEVLVAGSISCLTWIALIYITGHPLKDEIEKAQHFVFEKLKHAR